MGIAASYRLVMIVIAGRLRVKADRLDRALKSAAERATESRDEPGCLDYRFAVEVEAAAVVRIFEQWESQAVLEAHFRSAHFEYFSALIVDVVDSDSEFVRYEATSASPLFE